MMNIKTNPFKAVSFVESAIKKALDNAGYLIADIKYDGVRGNICVDNTANSCWLSRVSKTIPALEHLNGFDARWKRLLNDDRCFYKDGFMLDGELMVKGIDFNTGSGLLRTKWLNKKNFEFDVGGVPPLKGSKVEFALDTKRLCVKLYAILPLHIVESGEDCDVMTLLMQEHVKNMLPLLQEYFPEIEWQAVESYEVYDMVELQQLYEKKREEGHEGLIVKDPMCIYKRGKKSGWWKLKPLEEADGIIQGVNWGTEGLSNEGKVIGFSVLLESGCVVDANNISRELMDEFTANVKEHGEDYYNGWACQVGFMEVTPNGNLRHPSFTCFRGTEDNPKEKV